MKTDVLSRIAGALVVAAALACASKPSAPPGTVAGVAVGRAGHGLPGITVTSRRTRARSSTRS
jgi:hypothetical protein